MNKNQTESKPQDVEEPREEGLDETTCSGLGRHLSNIGDHRKPHAEMMHCYSYHANFDPAARRHEWESHLRWINENVIGPPKATDHYTQSQLEEMGIIGIYAPIDSQNDQRQATASK